MDNKIDDRNPHEQSSFDNIYKGSRGADFVNMIKNVLVRGNIKEKFIDKLLSKDAIGLYNIAFTHKSADPENNYEFLELLGDISANRNIVWYFSNRFPEINCPQGTDVLSRLKIKYISKKTYGNIGKRMGFWDFVTIDKKLREVAMIKTLEDVFEAFIGATEKVMDAKFTIGVGTSITYDIIKSFLDEMNISLDYDSLYDPKTRLKEFIDRYNSSDKSEGEGETSMARQNKNIFLKHINIKEKNKLYNDVNKTLSWLKGVYGEPTPELYFDSHQKQISETQIEENVALYNKILTLVKEHSSTKAKIKYVKQGGNIRNEEQNTNEQTIVHLEISGVYDYTENKPIINPKVIGIGKAYSKQDAEQIASAEGIKYITSHRIGTFTVPEVYKRFCSFDQIKKMIIR